MLKSFEELLLSCAALFVVVDPIGMAPVFASLARGMEPTKAQRTALRAVMISGAILFWFAAFGQMFLRAIHVHVDSFRMAGGLLLLLTSLDMMRGNGVHNVAAPASKPLHENHLLENKDEESSLSDIAVVPLSIPLIAGPGSMATVMMLVSREPTLESTLRVWVAVSLILVVTYFSLRGASRIERLLGKSIMAVTEKILGLVLAAMSIQFIVEGGLNLLRQLSLSN